MQYEYKVITLASGDIMNTRELTELFSQGWEYVDNITQCVSTGENTSYSKYGPVVVILKKDTRINIL